ncbi:hypothetical protein FN846DRAFT_1024543 [Sphaerosporella brunnea]|uniref:Uncharacterized protein n=1 Tax=Sphaerosporella brunnea TaxID=1250544 RepID=A0A5J5EIU8_9PEZI|nr:hypothetical protein FN846DRAFT_1024543 [Sphaerosporella brunnea]
MRIAHGPNGLPRYLITNLVIRWNQERPWAKWFTWPPDHQLGDQVEQVWPRSPPPQKDKKDENGNGVIAPNRPPAPQPQRSEYTSVATQLVIRWNEEGPPPVCMAILPDDFRYESRTNIQQQEDKKDENGNSVIAPNRPPAPQPQRSEYTSVTTQLPEKARPGSRILPGSGNINPARSAAADTLASSWTVTRKDSLEPGTITGSSPAPIAMG